MGESIIKKDIPFRGSLIGVDLNDLKGESASGLYEVRSGCTNTPASWIWLSVIGGSGTTQIAFSTSWIKTRAYTGNPLAWTEWKTVYMDTVIEGSIGYCKLSDGTMIQYAGANNIKSGDTISFPYSFVSNSGLRVFIQPSYNTVTTLQCSFGTASVTKDNFRIFAYDLNTKNFSTSTTLQFDWLAIGRWK